MDAKICVVIGTRAQLIKTAPLMQELDRRGIPYWFVYTAQHKDTIQSILRDFAVKSPDLTLLEWAHEAKSIKLFGSWGLQALLKLRQAKQIIPFTKGVVIVHGDTASAAWGALLGRLSGNSVLHLESGLRSFNLFHPFPEEILRLVTFRFTDIYACPGAWAIQNLSSYKGVKINTEHNTIVDILRFVLNDPTAISTNRPYAVVSVHRFENIYDAKRLKLLVELVHSLGEDLQIQFVLHPSTRVRLIRNGYFEKLEANEAVVLQDRMGYAKFIKLLEGAEFVVTDGGSNQEELSYLGVPTLLFRKATERPEGLGHNIVLSNYDEDCIQSFVQNYREYEQSLEMATVSPTKIVVDYLESQINCT